MGAVYRKTATKPLPEGAELFMRKGEQFARWNNAKGKARTAAVTTGRDGQLRIVLVARTFTAKYRDGSGLVREVSTGCRDETASRSILADLEGRAVRVKAKILTPAEDAMIDHLTTPLAIHLEDYERHLEALGTSIAYRKNTLRQLGRLASECEFAQLTDINGVAVERWLVVKAKQKMGARTRNSYRADAVGFGNWCVENGRLISNPFTKLPKADEAVDCRRNRRALTEPELVKLLDVARRRPLLDAMTIRRGRRRGKADAKLRPEFIEQLKRLGRERALIYKTLVLTGLRKGELASLTVGQLHLDGPHAFAELAAADEKNREGSAIPLRADLADDLRRWLADKADSIQEAAGCTPTVHFEPKVDQGGKRNVSESSESEGRLCLPMTGVPRLPSESLLFNVPDKLVKILDRDLVAAGIARPERVDGKWRINKRDERGRTIDVHALRHSFGTLLSKGGVAPRTAQAAMRHSSIDLTMNTYTDPKLLDVHGALDALPTLSLDVDQQSACRSVRATGTDNLTTSPFAPGFAPTIDNSSKSLSIAVKTADNSEPLLLDAQISASVDAVKKNNPLSTADNGLQAGWLTGLEPVTPRSTIWCSNQLSYSHRNGTKDYIARVIGQQLQRQGCGRTKHGEITIFGRSCSFIMEARPRHRE